MLLKVEDLACGYGDKVIAENINFQVNEGELWCVLGANGIGKSTLFKTLLGLIPAIQGSAYYTDISVKNWKCKDLARVVSYVPQSHIPPFPFRVFDVVAMGRSPYQYGFQFLKKSDADAVYEALDLLNIEGLADKNYTKISGGERQLVLLARAIVQETPLMILDEPVSNLDFGNHVRVLSHIRKLVTMGKTILMTTHHPEHAFIHDCKVLLLKDSQNTVVGEGNTIVDERAIEDMYGVKSKIILTEGHQKACLPIYKESI